MSSCPEVGENLRYIEYRDGCRTPFVRTGGGSLSEAPTPPAGFDSPYVHREGVLSERPSRERGWPLRERMALEPKIRDIMTKDVHGISEASSLATAARAMATRNVNSLLVWPSEREEPYGILTSSDLVDAIAAGKDLETTSVGSHRTTPLVIVTPGVRARDAAKLMARMNLRHLVVLSGKEIVGIVSNFDVVHAVADAPDALRPGPAEAPLHGL